MSQEQIDAHRPANQRFAGRVALVTGGASGIGRASVQTFSRDGAAVVIVDRDIEAGQALAASIEQAGGAALFVQADVMSRVSVERAFEAGIAKFGRIHYVFNNAGIPDGSRSLIDSSQDNWDRVIGVNLEGVWHCMTVAIRHMLVMGGGAIVNMSSRAGLSGLPKDAIYGASKHGVIGLTKAAAVEFAGRGIRINAVCPGLVRTPLSEGRFSDQLETLQRVANPLGRAGRPEEIAEAVAWLCSDASSFVVGIAMPLDGGSLAGQM